MTSNNHMKVVHLRPAAPNQDFYDMLLANMKAKDEKRVEKKYGKVEDKNKNSRA
jgi:hypothetical protein